MRLCLGLYNNVQRLPRIHSHIRGLFWTSKLFLLAWTWRPPLISQLTVCTCHLSECVYVWVCIIMCKDCREYIFTFMACFGHQSCFRWRRLGGRHWLHNCPFAHQSWANNVQRLRKYILTFVACFGHQSCFCWRRLGGRHRFHNCPFALVT